MEDNLNSYLSQMPAATAKLSQGKDEGRDVLLERLAHFQ